MARPVKRKPIVNMAASVRARLLNLSKQRRQPLDLLLTRYALERLLYRLSISKYRDRFILKGAMRRSRLMRSVRLSQKIRPNSNSGTRSFRMLQSILDPWPTC